MRPKDFLLVVVLIVVGLLAYHFLASGTSPGGDEADGDEVSSAYEAGDGGGEPRLGGRALDRRLATLERRVAELARLRAGGSATAGGDDKPPITDGTEWTDADLASLRAGFQKMNEQNRQDAEIKRYRMMVKTLLPKQDEDRREEVVQRLARYTSSLRSLYPAPTPEGITPERREELQQQVGDLRAQLEKDIQSLVTDEEAKNVLRSMPGGRVPGIQKPPVRSGPGVGSDSGNGMVGGGR